MSAEIPETYRRVVARYAHLSRYLWIVASPPRITYETEQHKVDITAAPELLVRDQAGTPGPEAYRLYTCELGLYGTIHETGRDALDEAMCWFEALLGEYGEPWDGIDGPRFVREDTSL